MVAIKAAEVDAFVARPDPARPVVLVFGPDSGLVSERANALIKASVDDVNDPFALARLEGEDLSAEPSRLVEEAQTIPLFGGKRAVWVKAGGRNIAAGRRAVAALSVLECRVVIEAGDLRRNAPLRAMIERAKNAAALPCYADDERARARLIDKEMREAGLKLAPDARAMLVPLLGGDRAASRSEIRKLALYARGQDQVGVEDVAAVVSDASSLGARRHCGRGLCGPDRGARGAAGKSANSRDGAGIDLLRRPAPGGATAQMAHGDRGRPGFSIDAALPPRSFAVSGWSKRRSSSGTPRGLSPPWRTSPTPSSQSRRNAALNETIAERALLAIAVNARRSAA